MKQIPGGVSAPLGFTASGLRCGVKAEAPATKRDLALILSDCDCTAAAVYTRNQVKAAPIYVSMENLKKGSVRGIVANSGNANACAPKGIENAKRMCTAAAKATGLLPSDFAVASTGVIGVELPIERIEEGLPKLASVLSRTGSSDAAAAILTTDLVEKEIAVEIEIGGKPVRLGLIAKGSGMIHPNMGTMLCFVTSDCCCTRELLQETLEQVTNRTFNRVTVDGDSSTNDSCFLLANGKAGNAPFEKDSAEHQCFSKALYEVMEFAAKKVAGDGEGASHLVSCTVSGCESEEKAEQMAKSVVGSSLVKAAMFGADANWGRVLCAIGYSGASFSPADVAVTFCSAAGEIAVCQEGAGLVFDEALAKKILSEHDVTIHVQLSEGSESATCWGCDLSYDYVKINGDYRS